MKRFLFICVALIAFLATNASGTSYHKSDQLQTFTVQQHFQITPAIMPVVEFTAVNQNNGIVFLQTNSKETFFTCSPPVYRNPDYGSYRLIGFNKTTNKYNQCRLSTARHV